MWGKKTVFTVCVVLVLILLVRIGWIYVTKHDDTLHFAVLDVGQGSSILITTPDETEILVDVGSNNQVLRQLGQQQWFFDRHIDFVVLSHPDRDHVGAVPELVERYSVDQVFLPRVHADTNLFRAIVGHLAQSDIATSFAAQGNKINVDDITIDILWPQAELLSELNRNEASLVLRVVYDERSFLIMGDAGVETEAVLIEQYGTQLQSDVLIVGHHGSDSSTSEELLQIVEPQYAVISSGSDNRYGHPHQSVTDRLNTYQIPTLRTDQLGTIEFISDGTQLLIQ